MPRIERILHNINTCKFWNFMFEGQEGENRGEDKKIQVKGDSRKGIQNSTIFMYDKTKFQAFPSQDKINKFSSSNFREFREFRE